VGGREGGGEDYGDVLDEDRAAALLEKPLEVLSRALPLRPAGTLGPSAATGGLVCMLGRRGNVDACHAVRPAKGSIANVITSSRDCRGISLHTRASHRLYNEIPT
jgi:hypothetical protein